MKQISRGSETTVRLNLLLTMCGFKSENIINALHDYLVKGYAIPIACTSNDIKSMGNLERAIVKVNDVAIFVTAIEDYDWGKAGKTQEQLNIDKAKMIEALNKHDVGQDNVKILY